MLLVELDVVLKVLISVLVWEQEREEGREAEAKERRERQEGLDEEAFPRALANLEVVQLVCVP